VAAGESNPGPASKIPLRHLSPGTKLSPNAVIDTLPTQKLPDTVRVRLVWLVVLFALELTTISVWLDAGSLSRAYFLTHLMLKWGAGPFAARSPLPSSF